MTSFFSDKKIHILSIALAIVFIWFGALKYTHDGATGIEGLVLNSPILSWVYSVLSVHAFAALLGTVEIAIGLLLLLGISNAKLGLLGGYGGIATFVVTLSFMLTTPGIVPEGASFPIISAMPGEFLLKDVTLLAVAMVLAGLHSERIASSAP